MYICNCNGITEKEVKLAIRGGARKWTDVHASQGCQPQCGKCECEIVRAIDQYSVADNKKNNLSLSLLRVT